MTIRLPTIALLALCLAAPAAAQAIVSDHPADTAAVDVFFSDNPETEAFLAELSLTLQQAREGQMGELTDDELAQMEDARVTIFTLLDGKARPTDLPAGERIDVFNAQEVIESILSGRPQLICKVETRVGTRVPSYSCLTQNQRMARRARARETANKISYGQER